MTIRERSIAAALELVKPAIPPDMPAGLRDYILHVAEVAAGVASDVSVAEAMRIAAGAQPA